VSTDEAVERQPEQTWWVRRWLKNELFWQGIVVQTLGTLAAAVIIALVAILTGVGYTPAVRYWVLSGLVTLLAIFLGVAIIIGGSRVRSRVLASSKALKRHPFGIGLLYSTLTIVATSLELGSR
jgi:threonine/homoserine/homoserine lactone efflux protein